MEEVIMTSTEPNHMTLLSVDKYLKEGGSVDIPQWFEGWEAMFVQHGQDIALWVGTRTDTKIVWKYMQNNFHSLTQKDVNDWVNYLSHPGGDGGKYDLANLEDSGKRIMDSIGPKLRGKVLYGGWALLMVSQLSTRF